MSKIRGLRIEYMICDIALLNTEIACLIFVIQADYVPSFSFSPWKAIFWEW